MKKTFKYIKVCLIMVAFLTSCEEELDLDNPNAFSLEELLQTADGFELLAIGVIDSYQKIPANEFLLIELRSDNSRANAQNGVYPDVDAYNMDANNGDAATYWSNNYATIFRANTIIENRFLAPEEFQYTIGEAYFFRALCHFNLVRAYQNVPYLDEVLDINSDEAENFPQLPPSQVYERIIEDFRTSIAFLNGAPQNRYRPSEGAAICLLAKTFLSQPNPNYAEAELLLASVVENNGAFGYDLLTIDRDESENFLFDADPTDPTINILTTEEYRANQAITYAKVFGNEFIGEFSSDNLRLDGSFTNNEGLELHEEIIFSISYEAINTDNVVSSQSGLDDQVETDAEGFSNAMTASGPSNGVNVATLDLLSLMTPELQPVRFDGTFRSITVIADDLLNDTFNSKYPSSGEANGNDWIVLRYADVLLLYAEAILAGGDSTTDTRAIEAFNQVRLRAGLEEVVNLTKQQLLEERRMEFTFENQRLYDLIRFNEADNFLGAHSDRNGFLYTSDKIYLPIPQRELDNLPGVYRQNNGY
ncbi:RagB/SusD family nutrient uptake outer membrane protein [uncultured Algibacter sp.]|uniref:RagB/SusD family nutrient uptake outer membrane protein n=1 Tax=uncultured Algibacter sp. TaxID=298659 RepID=UPI0026025E19|nr:RagB/SusD family nutrient uptake outer membrane protein [uncultured Algibacter sp.]